MPSKSAIQPVDEEVHLNHVPRSAQERYWALTAAKDASFDRVIGSTERITELRNDKQRADRDLAELEKAHTEGRLFVANRSFNETTGITQEDRSPDLARLGAAQRRAESARERYDRARNQHELLAAETNVYARLVRAAEAYFAQTASGPKLKAIATTTAALAKGGATTAALDRVREEIAALLNERRMVSRGAGSLDEAKALMRRAVADLAREGEPELATLFRSERPAIGWPQVVIPGINVSGYTVRTVNAAGLLAALFADELTAFLDKKIEAFGVQVEGEQMTTEQRAQRIADIDKQALALGYEEQSLLDRAATEGASIPPRPDADIRTVLMIEGPTPRVVVS